MILSINEFRRSYFSAKSRPTKREVVSWIEDGTAEGRRLRATAINGRYYIRDDDARDFLKPTPPTDAPSRRIEAHRARIADARRLLSAHGFNL